MSEENVEVVRRSFDALLGRPREGARNNTPEFEMRPLGRFGARPR